MVYADNLLKFTKYPFSYTLVVILLGTFGVTVDSNQTIFIASAGALGTLLTFCDPFRMLMESRAKNKIENSSLDKITKDYQVSALDSRPISFELEKITGLLYFFTILVILAIIVSISQFYSIPLIDNLEIKNTQDEIICDASCIAISSLVGIIVFVSLILIVENRYLKELDERIVVAGFLRRAIDSEYSTRSSVENMNRAVEQRDWNLATYWIRKIKHEIENKAGKQELILKSIENVFRPLYIETNKMIDTIDLVEKTFILRSLPTEEWKKIKQDAKHFTLEEPTDTKKIIQFYKLVSDFNNLIQICREKTRKYLLEMATTKFAADAQEITFSYLDNDKEQFFNLVNLLFFEKKIQDLPYYKNAQKLIVNRSQDNNDLFYDEKTQFDQFCKNFEGIFTKVNSDSDIKECKQLLDKLKTEIKKQIQRYELIFEFESKF